MEERKRAQRASRSINYVCVEGKKESRKSVCVCVKWLFFCISGGERDAEREREGEEKAKAIICTVCI
jgi:hypothetical protein